MTYVPPPWVGSSRADVSAFDYSRVAPVSIQWNIFLMEKKRDSRNTNFEIGNWSEVIKLRARVIPEAHVSLQSTQTWN
jgi:hypothetical protein